MTDNLSLEEVEEYRTAFTMLDRNRNGYITKRELGTILRNFGYQPTPTELSDLVAQVAVAGCETIDFTDYLMMMNNLKGNAEQEERDIREAFKIIDKDKNGFISAAELRHVMVNLGEQLSDEDSFDMIGKIDADENGQIDVEEFLRLMKSKPITKEEREAKEKKTKALKTK